jgi:phosphate transporter
MLLLGGFSIAAALSKHNIAQSLSTAITKTRLIGSNTRKVLAAYLFLATFTSMWISNVAAPTLCYSLIQPILKATTASTSRIQYGSQQAKHAETDRRLSKALVLGIALASNVGGLASPIASPQNLFAIEYSIGLGWIQWFSVSIPLCIVLDGVVWLWLVYCFDLPNVDSVAVLHSGGGNHSHQSSSILESFTLTQHFVLFVSMSVVVLWCISGNVLQDVTGQMGLLGTLQDTTAG